MRLEEFRDDSKYYWVLHDPRAGGLVVSIWAPLMCPSCAPVTRKKVAARIRAYRNRTYRGLTQ